MEEVDDFKTVGEYDFRFYLNLLIALLSIIVILLVEYFSIFNLTDWSFFCIPLLFCILIMIENRYLRRAFLSK
jgi:hypothetical protein